MEPEAMASSLLHTGHSTKHATQSHSFHCGYSHFIEGETEAQRGGVTCPGRTAGEWQS